MRVGVFRKISGHGAVSSCSYIFQRSSLETQQQVSPSPVGEISLGSNLHSYILNTELILRRTTCTIRTKVSSINITEQPDLLPSMVVHSIVLASMH